MKPTEILGCCKRGVSLQISTGKLTKKSETKLSSMNYRNTLIMGWQSWSWKSSLFQTTYGDIIPDEIIELIRLPAFHTYREILLKGTWNLSKEKKVAGADDIPLGIIKDYHKKIMKPLTYIVNLTSKSGTFPFIWNMQRLPQYIKPWI